MPDNISGTRRALETLGEKQGVYIAIAYIIYCVSILIFFKTLFRNNLIIPTLGFTLFFAFTVPSSSRKIEELLDTCIKFTISTIAIVLALLALITNEKTTGTLPHITFAKHTITWLMVYLFGTIVFAILGKGLAENNSKWWVSRLSLVMFLMAFLILLSFIGGWALLTT